MAKKPPEIPAADGTPSSCRRSPRVSPEGISAKKNNKEEDRREKKTAKTKSPIGTPCKKKVSMKRLLASQPLTNTVPAKRKRKRKRGTENNEDDHTTTKKKKEKNPVGRPPKNKKGSESNAADVKSETRVVVRVMEIGQVWAFPDAAAASSGGGGIFPRSYARIDRIIPIPSLVEVTPLIPQSVLDEEKQFAERGIGYGCGVFKASGSTLIKEMASFAHEAKFEVGGEGRDVYKIFPRKGEIWAVYWDSTSEYKLVEALTDFREKDGVNVYALAKVEGMDGVYERQLPEGFYMIRCFSRGFMPMFSHRVPATMLVESAAMRWKVALH